MHAERLLLHPHDLGSDGIALQIDDIATKTKFGSQALLAGGFTGRVFQVGAEMRGQLLDILA